MKLTFQGEKQENWGGSGMQEDFTPANIACDVDVILWPDPDQRQEAEAE